MFRIPIQERSDWRAQAEEYGFYFHTMHGERYWDESAYYQFTLNQIEQDLEAPTEEIHQMCLHVVDKVRKHEELMQRFGLPQHQWDYIAQSWRANEPSLYSRLDFAYDGSSPAKLYENNADTPTSLYETGFWQWLWLEQNVNQGSLSIDCDQFNSLQEKLILRLGEIFAQEKLRRPELRLHFACSKGTAEDRGTVQYLEDCAIEAGIPTEFVYVEDIGRDLAGQLTDSKDQIIDWIFKLYPWEFMLNESFGDLLGRHPVSFIEPPWKSLLSNKALLPMLWREFPDHPNLLPAYFSDEVNQLAQSNTWVKKPLFSREGANIAIVQAGDTIVETEGPYGQEGYIYQKAHMLPKFDDRYTLIGSWLVNDQAAGISVREDSGPITQDMSRYLPHVIRG